jgi:hypothetical protein
VACRDDRSRCFALDGLVRAAGLRWRWRRGEVDRASGRSPPDDLPGSSRRREDRSRERAELDTSDERRAGQAEDQSEEPETEVTPDEPEECRHAGTDVPPSLLDLVSRTSVEQGDGCGTIQCEPHGPADRAGSRAGGNEFEGTPPAGERDHDRTAAEELPAGLGEPAGEPSLALVAEKRQGQEHADRGEKQPSEVTRQATRN